jgi:hypothetical protein
MASAVPPRATFPEVMKVLFACQAKNFAWVDKGKDLRKTVLQREICKKVNDIAVGLAGMPVSLSYIPPSSSSIFEVPLSPSPSPSPRKRQSVEQEKPIPAPRKRRDSIHS